MAAEPSRRGPKSTGLIVRPQAVSDKSYVESVVGFIHEVVPQAKWASRFFSLLEGPIKFLKVLAYPETKYVLCLYVSFSFLLSSIY
ncbi:hypothetical protein AVEN_232148-1 [Araneus ventricosus]|uniref:Uncharacterized protein n=1 Tax=Araneus ventricosus TaxID=182803 RepID=A0A4Y2VU40_ARAVE|nr:hypothetical protein AVEN_232148-1 [Araneus ventricosus]